MSLENYQIRFADEVLNQILLDHAAVLVTGPRACGKTTTAKRKAATFLDLSSDQQANALRLDPRTLLHDAKRPVLLDEWQLVPESLSAIKAAVDTDRSRGQFLVTGSVRAELNSPTWPGTGRLIRMPMFGLTEREVEGRVDALDETWLSRLIRGEITPVTTQENILTYLERALRSGFPEPAFLLGERARIQWLTAYIEQLLTRDAEMMNQRRDPQRLRAYLQALALNSAGVVDDTTLFTAAKLAKDTAREYHRLLMNLLIVDEIPAWTANRLKRLALAPKRYLVDPGLLTGVLGLTVDDLRHDANLLGRVMETFVVAQVRAELALMVPMPRLHHLRTHQDKQEVDLIIEVGQRIIAIEIKSTASPHTDDARHLVWLKNQLGHTMIAGVVLHTGPYTLPLAEGILAVPIAALWEG